MSGQTSSRGEVLPYGRQDITDDDVNAVVAALRSDFLTTGPAVDAFEDALCHATGADHAVAVSNGTAALHAMVAAAGIGPGDEVIVPAITFAATGNAALYQGARPVIVDVEPDTLLMDPGAVQEAVGAQTKGIVGVDYAGQPTNHDALEQIANDAGAVFLSDAAHSIGATYHDKPVGSLATMTAFSFHPVKTITTAEGGAVTTDDADLARFLRRFRSHGIDLDAQARQKSGVHQYSMRSLGHNMRLSDVHAALGESQLGRLGAYVTRRQALSTLYEARLRDVPGVTVLAQRPDRTNARHLFVVLLEAGIDRDSVFASMRDAGIGVNVHYLPLHRHAYYQAQGLAPDAGCPVAEDAHGRMLSLPLFPAMADGAVGRVVGSLSRAISAATDGAGQVPGA